MTSGLARRGHNPKETTGKVDTAILDADKMIAPAFFPLLAPPDHRTPQRYLLAVSCSNHLLL